MKNITYTQAHSQSDLDGILQLQKANLPAALSPEEIRSQGFVTVNHSYEQLKSLNDHEKHIIAKDQNKVVGYVLAMTNHSRNDIPVLLPMFELFDKISFNNKKIAGYNYIVVGQVCMDREYRGQGLFDNCYAAYRDHYKDKYDFAITEIAETNLRSLNAHKRIGFQEINRYTDRDNRQWVVVVWDWNEKNHDLRFPDRKKP